ncbi:hypothetical protein NBRC110019_05960 [Neptunitalea chrysea]|uniref:Sulfotransferase n=1 Tax=Neptunitalea chrysea TaxID=1647581 RepID=A0A9W6B496_9FLAO|nr:sulfotransferase [Neptunitalea chrysea]GLB51557.1 hypothetical protein NBRC110019_05960 [Neptunitalea chrysea]
MIFIIGAPRSGTKLLRQILNNHSQIYIPEAETMFLYKLYLSWDQFKDLSDRNNFDELVQYILETPFYSYLKEEHSEKIIDFDKWYSSCSEWSYSHVMMKFFEICAFHYGKSMFGDKTPSYLYPIDFIRNQFKEVRIIHIVRDPRDYVLSVNKAWGKNIFRSAQRWNDWLNLVNKDLGLKEDNILVTYENLLSNSEKETERILSFLKISYEPNLFVFNGQIEPVGDAKNEGKIKKDNFGKWKRELSSNKLRIIEELCYQNLKDLGYKIELGKKQKKLSNIKFIYYKGLDSLSLLIYAYKRKGYLGLKRQLKLMIFSK